MKGQDNEASSDLQVHPLPAAGVSLSGNAWTLLSADSPGHGRGLPTVGVVR
jgi:hypothetical protein